MKCGVKYEKEVYTVPGNINTSTGTNMLIKDDTQPYLLPKNIVLNINSSQS